MKKTKKIIFINRYFYPDESATSQILSDLAFELAVEHDDIWVVCSRLLYSSQASLNPEELINNVHVKRVWTSSFGRSNLLGRAADYITFYISCFMSLLFLVSRNDIVIAKTDPPLISVVAAVVCKFRGASLINWIQDLFPEVAGALGMKLPSAIIRLLVSIRNISLKSAVNNVVIGFKMKDRLIAEGVPVDRITVIDNWSDGESIKPVLRENNLLRKQWGFENQLIVGYSGNMGRAHEFETILSAAQQLNDNADIVFLFIGGGAKKQWLEDQVVERRLRNVVFKPYQDRDQLTLSLCVPDVHLISLYPALEGLIVPSKFYGIAAASRPSIFIGSDQGELSQILAENTCGMSFSIGDSKGLSSFLTQSYKNIAELQLMGCNARALFDTKYNKYQSVSKWKALLEAYL